MTILEILKAHRTLHVSHLFVNEVMCKCGQLFADAPTHRAHVAEVLDKHMQEREAEAWELGAQIAWQRSSPTVNGTNYYWRSSGEPVNPHRKEPHDGR